MLKYSALSLGGIGAFGALALWGTAVDAATPPWVNTTQGQPSSGCTLRTDNLKPARVPFPVQNPVDTNKVYVLRAARILEPKTGEMTKGGHIVVRGQCIIGVNAPIPPDAETVDLGDVTLLPGLTDLHTHIFLRDEDQVFPYSILWKTNPYRTIEGVDAAFKTLSIGFTTVRDLDDEGAVDADTALRDAIARGVMPGPQLIVAGTPISITGGDMNLPLVNPELQDRVPQPTMMADSPDALIATTRATIKRGADLVKIYATSTRRQTDPTSMEPLAQFDTEQVRTVVNEARRFGRDVAAHVYGGKAAEAAINGGVRTLEHGPLLTDQNIQQLAKSQSYWIPTLITYQVRQTTDFERRFVDRHRQAFQKALRAGVKIGFGTDVGSFPHGTQNREFELMVQYGMSPLDAIRSATNIAATVLRLDGQIGTLAPGSDADIIAVAGDPVAKHRRYQEGTLRNGGRPHFPKRIDPTTLSMGMAALSTLETAPMNRRAVIGAAVGLGTLTFGSPGSSQTARTLSPPVVSNHPTQQISLDHILYPAIEPNRTGMLPVDNLHTLYWEESGRQDGVPVVYLHGGPGAGSSPRARRFFDPGGYRIIIYDQRGAGRSTPFGELRRNTTQLLVADMERLREHLGISRWVVAGGSWGATLALAYAVAHPQRVLALHLRGVYLSTQAEVDWFVEGARVMLPEAWDKMASLLTLPERRDVLSSYYKRVRSPNPAIHIPALAYWNGYEAYGLRMLPDQPLEAYFQLPAPGESPPWGAAIEMLYLKTLGFMPDGYLLRSDVLAPIQTVPTFIVNGRCDVVCPPIMALRLHKLLPQSELILVSDAGHSAFEPGNASALVDAARRTLGLLGK